MNIILYYLSGMIFFYISLLMLILSMIFLFMNFMIFIEWNLLMLNTVTMNMFLYFDWMTFIFMFTVLMISSMIMFYCCEYMKHDNSFNRFFFLVFLFVVSMLLMIISPNMVSIILGWDGLGLISYCLVIYYQSYFSYNSGMLTVLMNRVGDIMIMMSISLMFIYGSWNFMNLNFINKLLIFFLIVASFTKSAQFPFSSWLPAAMAAPTPVSSLVHSSTLVTAGVYLLIRFNYLIYKNSLLLNYLIFFGMLTMMIAGLSANFEYDMKKIIAYSTLSQLGLMVVIFGMKFYLLSFFHLIIHAMFKSMMFMCSGIIIHSMLGVQDIRFMGNLIELMPLTLMMLMISNFSLCGLPFLSGFYSKDLILEKIFMNNFSLILFMFLIFSTMLTVVYSVRLLYYLINKNYNFYSIFKVYDLEIMNFSMIILLINSIFLGFLMNWLIYMNIEEIYLMIFEKIMILLFCFISIFMGIKIYKMKFFGNWFFNIFFCKMWFLYFMNMYIYSLSLKLMKSYYYLFDKGVLKFIFEDLMVNIMMLMDFKIYNKNLLVLMLLMMSYLFILMMII